LRIHHAPPCEVIDGGAPEYGLLAADVGSTANTKPALSAASATRLVTTPASENMLAVPSVTPGSAIDSTGPNTSSFSVLMTADQGVIATTPPVYPVPPPRGIIVSPSSIQARTRPGISFSVSGASTMNGNSTRQSVASVT
jgi:hypothetical protein